ncbi:fatty acid desaturase [Ferrovum sp. PN-J185]|uniref:fatty acid desaturase n=1 Tax=Ferrovum sp. PN-J185 TaxID=1356306 RepID=UPI000795B035|nr:fatty acid desaturase [Ferrovum sp. PN-J185]KXW55520.1 alkane 1-monooxygenase [Ferrovum sp. PN-J185]MCC6067923.1 fatty acid desaturase [Ferrovum sp. PN-J185]MDE1891266.1 fatty acid desaturase [Betaproteobacteria bacterium]MDE2056306.1 fatty acid desaturase [Betaproteobacteria bacterium]
MNTSIRQPIYHPVALLGALIAIIFAWLPSLCLILGHPGWPLWIGLIALPILELVFHRYQGPIPYWRFGVLRVIIAVITIQGIVGALLAVNYPWWLVILAGAGSGYAAGGSGNALGHELGHSRSIWDKRLAKWFFTTVCFGHYTQEHGAGHHVLVGTPKDSLYTHVSDNLTSFSKRNMIKQLRLGIEIATARRNIWSEVYGPIFFYIVLNIIIGYFAGFKGVVFMMAQTIVMYMVDASITFIQHWALHRNQVNGRYERVGPQHTWDCNNWITTVVSFNNCRHVDHHINPGKDLNGLENVPEAPQMPYGYAVMGTLANFPGLFRRVMEPHLPQH